MIKTFGDKDTQKNWLGERVIRLALPIQNIARRKLRMMNSAVDLKDLKVPPANHLEKLKGDQKEF
jgi:proteic killer suppression protein